VLALVGGFRDSDWEEEGLFKAKAMNGVDAGCDRATPAWVRHDDDEPLTPISPGGVRWPRWSHVPAHSYLLGPAHNYNCLADKRFWLSNGFERLSECRGRP
jgi:hypothetical protein